MRANFAILLCATLGLAACAPAAAPSAATPTALAAKAELKDKDGNMVATVALTQTIGGVRIQITATKLPPGTHGWHIHAVGKCEPPDFATAGGHLNPDGKKHGASHPEGPHAGDLGNFTVGPDGTGAGQFTSAQVTLEQGAARSLLKADGTAIVVHATADDEKTDPAGNSGARIACGVVR